MFIHSHGASNGLCEQLVSREHAVCKMTFLKTEYCHWKALLGSAIKVCVVWYSVGALAKMCSKLAPTHILKFHHKPYIILCALHILRDPSCVFHQARAYPSFCSMKWLGVVLLSLDEMLVFHKVATEPICTWVKRDTLAKNTIQWPCKGLNLDHSNQCFPYCLLTSSSHIMSHSLMSVRIII